MELDDIHLAQRFTRFADQAVASPMYRFLAFRISEDERCLRIASKASSTQPIPNLFLAAIHFVLMNNPQSRLARHYPSLGGAFRVEANGELLFSDFKTFCEEHESALIRLMQNRLVQTNEVQRTAVLLPALKEVARSSPHVPGVTLIDIGASAGLNLLVDRVFIDYSDGNSLGPVDSPLKLTCEVKGHGFDSFNVPLNIVRRIAVDLNPIDLNVADELLWTKSLLWPDQPERLARFERAVDLLATTSIDFRKGDGNEILPGLLREVPRSEQICVMHSFVLNQFSLEARNQFEQIVASASAERDVWRVGLEWIATEHPELTVALYRDGKILCKKKLAECDGHGAWLNWKSTF